jgi:multiple sugar transport system permease protein
MRPSGALSREHRISFYVFLCPWILGFLALWVFPLGWGLAVSLTNRTFFMLRPRLVGFGNYVALLRDPAIRGSFQSTFLYTAFSTCLGVGTSLVLALLIEKLLFARSLLRTLLYLPCVIPEIAMGGLFRFFLERDTGFLNSLLVRIGVLQAGVPWLVLFPRGVLVSLAFWQAGWGMVILLAGLATIPEELVDAARIDGAGFLHRLRRVTLPLLSPFILYLVVVGFISSMQSFLLPFLLSPFPVTRGVNVLYATTPPETTFVMMRALFLAVSQGRIAYSLSLVWMLVTAVVVLTILLLRLGRVWVFSETDS